MTRMKRHSHGRESEMLRYFRDQTSDFDEALFRRSLERIAGGGLKADEMEACFSSFSEDERRARFGTRVHGELRCGAFEDLSADEFRFVLLKQEAERRMLLVAARTERHAAIPRPAGSWKASGGGFIRFGLGDERLSIDVLNRSWNSAIASETTENHCCIRACLENYARFDPFLSKLEVSISISMRGKVPGRIVY